MKIKILFAMVCLALVQTVHAAKPLQAKIQRVTVYLQGAHLYYSEAVYLQAGNNEIIFENISPYIQIPTLQANSKGGTLMEVSHQVRYREVKSQVKQYDHLIAQVKDSLEENGYLIVDVENKLSVLAQEKKMLLNNRIIRGDSPKDSLPLLKESMEFTHQKLNEILEQELKWSRNKNKLSKESVRLEMRYQQLMLLQNGSISENGDQAIPINQVVLSIFAEQAGTAQVSFNYFIQQAGWAPNYDLLANSVNNQIQLKYFANISQNSGLNWNQAALTLSTSNPMERNIKPQLSAWFIGFLEYRKFKAQEMSQNRAMTLSKNLLDTRKSNADDVQEDMESKSLSEYIAITENLIRTEYEIKLKYEIESDGKAHKVMVREQNIPMMLAFAAVPKLCADAFLMGRVSGWEDLNILPGSARIYFDGAYVGETYLNNQSTNDTLDFNLGKDKSIVLTRRKVKEKTKVKNLENERIETRSIELVVRNTKGVALDMVLEDQIPLVQNTNEIKVNLLEADGSILDETTGFLKWNLKLGAKESKKIVFTYEIRYPKNKQVYGL